ncbi:hypothetical protein Pcinc_000399 [Petrolisthes cinctipes]|uniref:Uncharacterized protein n=1 Tax=Petrolisthes cinctipes TaxID=88211 RepID=A0AAE1L430_PETCI|nr:hypothetical protein Pcinc_000399 [Petrolisthes cinctipes]
MEPRPTLTKFQLQKLVLEHFMEEEVLDRNEVQDNFSLGSGDTEEARLSLERERVKLEILREQNKAKELSYLSLSDKYLPCFDEGQPETFFSQFEKNAAIHRWPPGTWAVLLSNAFTGEARRAYAGLSVDESLDYATVKSTILRVYKRVPAYYRKIFRTSQKRANQTCVEFYREKLAQCQRNKLPLTQSSLKLNPNPSGPREPVALSPLQGCPRFTPMNSGSVSPDDSLQPSHSVTIFRDSGSVRTFVLREAISSFPQCQTGHSLVVRGLFSKVLESELTAESQCLVVTSSPDVEESDITTCSHLVVPNDNEEERADAVVEPVLQNSEVLKNPGEKLAHLQEKQAASIVHLLQEHVALFSDSPSLCPLLRHDVDVQASHPEKSEKGERRESVGVSIRTRLGQVLRETFVLVMTPGLRLKAFVIFYLWITSSAIYFGVSLNSYNLSINIYLYTFLGGLLEIPAYLLLWLATATLGRKKTFAILFLICGISISLLTTLILLLQKVFSVGALVAAAVVFILPETANKNMPQGIDEDDDNDRVYSRDV